MSIELLKTLITPPTHPLHNDNEERWENVQNQLSIRLPDDLRRIGQTYGSGDFGGYLGIHNPFSENYVLAVNSDLDSYRGEYGEVPFDSLTEEPYNIYPSSPGLFPWGRDDNGFNFCFHTLGDPNKWEIVIVSRERDVQTFDNLTVTEFLYKIFTNEISYLDPPQILPCTFMPVNR